MYLYCLNAEYIAQCQEKVHTHTHIGLTCAPFEPSYYVHPSSHIPLTLLKGNLLTL